MLTACLPGRLPPGPLNVIKSCCRGNRRRVVQRQSGVPQPHAATSGDPPSLTRKNQGTCTGIFGALLLQFPLAGSLPKVSRSIS